MRAWPKPQAWRRATDKGWQSFHPTLDIPRGPVEKRLSHIIEKLTPPSIFPGATPPLITEPLRPELLPSLLREQARLNWIKTIPDEVRQALRTFPKHQWHLLRMIGACGTPAMDLMHATPALAVALSCAPKFRPIRWTLRAWRTLLKANRSQADIAAWLGFPGTKATIRLLRKVDAKCLHSSALIYLRAIASDPRLQKRSAHLPSLTRSCVFLLSNPMLEPLVGQRLLHEVAENPQLRVSRGLLDILRMIDTLHPAGRQVGPFETSTQVLDLHNDLVGRMQAIELADLPIPPPPISGNEFIQPIQTPQELAEEGRQMGHCVASYLRDIHRGRVAVYRVLAPERATLSLRVIGRETLHWAIDQLFLARNQEPSAATHQAVRSWFAKSSSVAPNSEDATGEQAIGGLEGFGDVFYF